MPSVVACPAVIFQFLNNQGEPAANGTLLTQVGGVNYPTYSDSAGTVPLRNPIPLNSRGEVSTADGSSSQLFIVENTVYVFTLYDASGNLLWSAPYVNGAETSLTQAEFNALFETSPGVWCAQTAIEIAANILPTNFTYLPGNFYRYGAKGGGGRVSDGTITAGSPVVMSPSGGFANAQAGMTCVVVDGSTSRTGGRPAPLIALITSVQSATQITLNSSVTQPGTVMMTGTLAATTAVTATSVNPITAGVGLVRSWTATDANGYIPAGTTLAAITSSTLTLSQAATNSGTETITLAATTEVCFGWDDSTAILASASLPYPVSQTVDTFLLTKPLPLGGTGCNNFAMPEGSLLIFAISNNSTSCVTASGYDRQNSSIYVGMRYTPFEIDIGEIDCCNTGLDGFSLQPSTFSHVKMRITNPFRNALCEWFSVANEWQEGNIIDINCAHVGLHFHHKVTQAAFSYQNLASYRIQGRACGLNSAYLGINPSTQPDQCGGAVRIYSGGDANGEDGGTYSNQWGAFAPCEFDGERTLALSYGSDICNSAITLVDASGTYVIEGAPAAHYSNIYIAQYFGSVTIEDITQGSDVRSGYQYYAMPNITVQSCTIFSPAFGPWGQTYINTVWFAGSDNFTRWGGFMNYAGDYIGITAPGAPNYGGTFFESGIGSAAAAPPTLNANLSNTVAITGTFTTVISGDYNLMFFCKDSTTGGGAIGYMTTDTTTVTVVSTTLTDIAFQREASVGLQAHTTGGTTDRNLVVMAFAVG